MSRCLFCVGNQPTPYTGPSGPKSRSTVSKKSREQTLSPLSEPSPETSQTVPETFWRLFGVPRPRVTFSWAAANGGVTNKGLRVPGRPSRKSALVAPFLPFSPFLKRREKAFFLRYPQICLNPHLLNPHPKNLLRLFFRINLARQKITSKNKNNLARLFLCLF